MEKQNTLLNIEEVISLIKDGKYLIIAGNEDKLSELPKGNWIGGTIPYFMDVDGGCLDKNKLFVTDYTELAQNIKICLYNENEVEQITKDRFDNGFSYILIPCFSNMLTQFAMKAQSLPDLYNTPLLGWVTGIDLAEIETMKPKVFNGKDALSYDNSAIVMHCDINSNLTAAVEIINIFSQGEGDKITFEKDGFKITDCYINGNKTNLAEYITENKIDTRFPMVANYSGAMINISFQQINEEDKSVLLYAPVKSGVDYKLAKPIVNYENEFKNLLPDNLDVVSSCNCILNYLYSELEGKKVGKMTGPFTFGEIAYVLVNQTLVYLKIV